MVSIDCKIVTLGEGRVGKTSLTLKFVKNEFHKDEISTVNANFLTKSLHLENGEIKLNIWDTAGQERYRALTPNYYRQANGALLAYDITDRKSFERVISWIAELQAQADKNIVIVVAGNKCDMEKERQVNRQEALEFCRKRNIKHFDTSAKTGAGVDEIFSEIGSQILKVHENEPKNEFRKSRKDRRISIAKNSSNVKDKKCC